MEKLILEQEKEETYRLEIPTNGEYVGDYIEFDLADLNLPQRIMEASDRLRVIDDERQAKELKIEEEEKDNVEKIRKLLLLDKEYSKEMRDIFDSFLGEGTCQKIFGDKEHCGQYLRLMNALEPHFKKMHLDIQKAKKRIVERIKQENKDVI